MASPRVKKRSQRYLSRKRSRRRQAPMAKRKRSRTSKNGQGGSRLRSIGWVWSGGQRDKDLPTWRDLAREGNQRTLGRSKKNTLLEGVPTTRLALLILAIAGLFTLYVGHVHATQEVYAELQHAQNENLRLHLKHNRLKGEFDRITGPAVVHRRAQALGLEGGITYGPTIEVEGSE